MVRNGDQKHDSGEGNAEARFGIALGERAFEIVLARKRARGEVETTWFSRHDIQPITELPADWPEDYRRLVERRIEVIESNPQIALIEQPEYKRRWNTEPWESQQERALRNWLLDRLESYFDFDGRMNDEATPTAQVDVELVSVARLADLAARDGAFMEAAELYRSRRDFDVGLLVAELVREESVPLLPVLRYKPSGLDKRKAWERTWDLQRLEDAIDARTKLPADHPEHLSETQAEAEKLARVGDIPVPPKYTNSDFISTGGAKYWRLRGKLDVPKERWVSFPHCEGKDQHASRRLGRLRPPPARPGRRRLLRQGPRRTRRLRRPPPRPPPRRPAGTDPLAETMAQRRGPGVQHADGGLF